MDFNLILLLIVGCSCVSFLLRTAASRQNRGWAIAAALILMITGVLLYFAPAWASWVGGGLWAIFLVLPLAGFTQVNQLILQGHYRDAQRWMTVLRWLHPWSNWFCQTTFLQALEMGQQGKIPQALAHLEAHNCQSHPLGRNAIASLMVMEARWPDLLQWLQTNVPEPTLRKDPHLLMHYLRALGEVGDLNGLLLGLKRYGPALSKRGGNTQIPLQSTRLLAMALCGQPRGVNHLLQHQLMHISKPSQQFWRLTGQWAAEPTGEALEQLRILQKYQNQNFALQKAIAWRLDHPPHQSRSLLGPTAQQILGQIQRQVQHETQYGRPLTVGLTSSYVTYCLLLVNLGFFALEIHYGGSQHPPTLDQLGALIPDSVRQGEWWRLLNANFLHYGWTHLLTNLTGLYLLGPFVEKHLGRWRYLLTYLLAGVGTMGIFTIRAVVQNNLLERLVGASAAIMALLGVILVILWHGCFSEKSRVAGDRLRSLSSVVVLQFVFDVMIPEISVLAHTVGLILGLGLGVFWLKRMPQPRRSEW